MVAPAAAVVASGVLVSVRFGQFTVMVTPLALADPPLLRLTDAEFDTVPHVARVVGEVMWKLTVALGPRFPPGGVQVSVAVPVQVTPVVVLTVHAVPAV